MRPSASQPKPEETWLIPFAHPFCGTQTGTGARVNCGGEGAPGHDYEPYHPNRREVALHNCPFNELARQASDLVCGMNHAFLKGLTKGLGSESVQVLLEPSEVECCVRLRLPESSKGSGA